MVDPEIFAAVQEMIEKDSAVKEVCLSMKPMKPMKPVFNV